LSSFFVLWVRILLLKKKILLFGKKNVILLCRFVRYLFNRLRKKSDKMTMKSEIM